MIRYAQITTKMPREFVLLQGQGCAWQYCTFCDYHLDVSSNPFAINKEALSLVTGRFGILDVINSGSCLELDEATLDLITAIAQEKQIRTLWFEAHWIYHDQLAVFAARFRSISTNLEVKFRVGIETFDIQTRERWQKGIPASVTIADLTQYFHGACLLVGVAGQTQATISQDIEIALANFEYFSVNVFVENTTTVKRDLALIEWFIQEWYERLEQNPKVEVLLNNTDLGVG